VSRRLPLILGALLALAVAAPAAARPHDETRTTLGILTPLIGLDAPDVIAEARALGVDTVRLSQDVANPTVRPALHVVQREGLKLLLTVNNAQERDAQGNRPGHPPVTPEELAAYHRRLGSLLDALQRPPVLLQVENEEIEPRFFAGTMTQYLGELDAAVAVAHARGIEVTNGGITGRPLALLTWQHYRNRGLEARADDFARRTFTRPQDAGVLQDLLRRPFTGLRRQPLQAAWDRASELVAAFRASRMDYVNFHWYFDDDRSLRQAVRYLRRATGKPVVTTEVGQHNTEPAVVTGHLRTLVKRLRLPFVIWFDADGTPALGLHDAPGVLRPNGIAFRDFVARTSRCSVGCGSP
jgi:hypothetical protein